MVRIDPARPAGVLLVWGMVPGVAPAASAARLTPGYTLAAACAALYWIICFIGLFVLLDYLLLKRRKPQRQKEHKG